MDVLVLFEMDEHEYEVFWMRFSWVESRDRLPGMGQAWLGAVVVRRLSGVRSEIL